MLRKNSNITTTSVGLHFRYKYTIGDAFEINRNYRVGTYRSHTRLNLKMMISFGKKTLYFYDRIEISLRRLPAFIFGINTLLDR